MMTKEIDYVELLKLAHEKLGSQSDMIAELEGKIFKQSQESKQEVSRAIEIILEKDEKIAELENPWISVDDRLPEPKDKILLHSDSLEVFSGRGSVLIATNTMPEPVLGIRSRYTHWMPQPLPKEQE
jgi:hypothetical protein